MCKLISLLLLLVILQLALPSHLVYLQCRMQLVDGAMKKVCRQAECPIECKNGFCYMRCSCNVGYQMVDGSCVPSCEHRCPENAYCRAPNECVCKDGYAKSEWHNGVQCVPVCTAPCSATQHCTAPNTCSCRVGYQQRLSGGCEPICSKECGLNERCVAPERCDCAEGYERKDKEGIQNVDNGGLCAPVCDAKYCENADCIEPDVCVCHDGYVLNFDVGKCELTLVNTSQQSSLKIFNTITNYNKNQ